MPKKFACEDTQPVDYANPKGKWRCTCGDHFVDERAASQHLAHVKEGTLRTWPVSKMPKKFACEDTQPIDYANPKGNWRCTCGDHFVDERAASQHLIRVKDG